LNGTVRFLDGLEPPLIGKPLLVRLGNSIRALPVLNQDLPNAGNLSVNTGGAALECLLDMRRPDTLGAHHPWLKHAGGFQWRSKQGWQKNCGLGGVMMKVFASLLFIVLLATACSTPQTPPVVRFNEQDQANLIVRYYTDQTSYVLKPQKTDGPFLSILRRDDVLEVAKQSPGRELAVVILVLYPYQGEADSVQSRWTGVLRGLGYQRVVFLGGYGGKQVNGLPVLAQAG
jgi:hypothetical protein